MIAHIFDLTLKLVISNNLEGFFEFLELDCKPILGINNEFIDSNLKKSIMDFPVNTDMGVVGIEFQKETKAKDLKRFARYMVELHEKTNEPVHLVVLDLTLKKDDKKEVKINENDKLTIYLKSLTQKGANTSLNRIKNNIENNIGISRADFVALELIPFMDLDRKEELLIECAKLIGEIDGIDEDKLKEITDLYTQLATEWNVEEALKILGAYYMEKVEFTEEMKQGILRGIRLKGIEEGIEKGRVEGREEGEEIRNYEVAKDMIDRGYPTEEISLISHLDMKIINHLMLSK